MGRVMALLALARIWSSEIANNVFEGFRRLIEGEETQDIASLQFVYGLDFLPYRLGWSSHRGGK